MVEQNNENGRQTQTPVYEIEIQGHIGATLATLFQDMQIVCQDNGTTLLTGSMVDQAALYGTLKRIRDLGKPLISINQIQSEL